jgi:hypothetical protein
MDRQSDRQFVPGRRPGILTESETIARAADAAELTRRIALARSILGQRRWAWQDEPHVRDVLAALDGSGITEILRRAG